MRREETASALARRQVDHRQREVLARSARGELYELDRLEVLHPAANALGGVEQHVSPNCVLHYLFLKPWKERVFP